ncbi:MAG: hypothetical protein JOS17DRAFT_256515 [Linnemannia elongata]|nr:MAG: hypothetical protein JOS17DRAFT_256515 [Linnemannia elongata]
MSAFCSIAIVIAIAIPCRSVGIPMNQSIDELKLRLEWYVRGKVYPLGVSQSWFLAFLKTITYDYTWSSFHCEWRQSAVLKCQ